MRSPGKARSKDDMGMKARMEEWDREVTREADRLQLEGLSEAEAREQARIIVFKRRRMDRKRLPMMDEAENSVLVKPTPKEEKQDGYLSI